VTILLGTLNRWVMSFMNFAAAFDMTIAMARTSTQVVLRAVERRQPRLFELEA
jgi:hypothetical protein